MRSLFLLATALLFTSKMAAENRVSPTISEVTVYRQGAKISSVATVRLAAGANEIVFENLSPYFNPNSLQVKIGGGSAQLLSAIFRQKSPEPIREPARSQIIRDSLVLLGDRLADSRAEADVLQGEANVLAEATGQVGIFNPQTGRVLTVEELKNLTAFYTKRQLEIKLRLLEIERNQRKINEFYQKLSEILRRLSPNTGNPTGEIALKISAQTGGQAVEIVCTYLVTQAGWSPLYDLRTAGVDKPLNLVYRANVHNSSGFDWKNVRVHLSSGQPLANNERPVLSPIWVDFRPVYAMQKGKNQQEIGLQNIQNMAQAPAMAYSKEETDMARAGKLDDKFFAPDGPDDGLLINFDLEKPQDILANGQENIVLVGEQEMACVYEYHAVPKLECAVFLLAKVPDYGKYSLLPGVANLFLEETFVGQATINPKTTADTLLLSLGRDDQISIKRTQPQDLTGRKNGIFGSSKKETNTFEIAIKNNKRAAIRLEIIDQYPLSKQEDIKVELEEAGGAQVNTDLGKLTWKLDLPPGGSQKLRFSYSIKYPKDRPVGTFK